MAEKEHLKMQAEAMVVKAVWNLAIVVVSVVVLLLSLKERPSTPLRLWIAGYALQCLMNLGCIFFDHYHNKWYCTTTYLNLDLEDPDRISSSCHKSNSIINFGVRLLEIMYIMVPLIWWFTGNYWIYKVGGQALEQDSPHLYWLTKIFLAFDTFLIIFWIGTVCFLLFSICIALVLLAILYATSNLEGGSVSDDILHLPQNLSGRDRHEQLISTIFDDEYEKLEDVMKRLESGNNKDMLDLCPKDNDSECCICLSNCDDGAEEELCALPCNHQFHCECISKWLRISAICPLCKLNIIIGDDTLV